MTSQENDTGTGGWVSVSWVKDLFNNEPSVVTLGELHREGGGFHYDFVVSVKLSDGTLRHYMLEWMAFAYNTITQLVRGMLVEFEDNGTIGSRWMEEWPTRRTTRLKVNRQTLGLAEPKTELELTDEDVFAHYGVEDKAATAMAKPPVQQDGEPDVEWARKLTLAELETAGRFKMRVLATNMGLMKNEADKTAFCGMDAAAVARFLYDKLHPKKPTVESVAADREERIAAGHERRTAKGESLNEPSKRYSEPHVVSGPTPDLKAGACTECGAAFATNERFGSGDERLCGDCEAKHDEARGQRQVHLEFVFQRRRRLLVPKRTTRFDPRPGIDDVGLGGYGPNWED